MPVCVGQPEPLEGGEDVAAGWSARAAFGERPGELVVLAKVCHNTMTDLAVLIPVALHELQVAVRAGLARARGRTSDQLEGPVDTRTSAGQRGAGRNAKSDDRWGFRWLPKRFHNHNRAPRVRLTVAPGQKL
jgi:hypothetical protein